MVTILKTACMLLYLGQKLAKHFLMSHVLTLSFIKLETRHTQKVVNVNQHTLISVSSLPYGHT